MARHAVQAKRVPWGDAMRAALADGEWHDIEDVYAAAAAVVPPGVAFRAGERARDWQRAQRGHTATALSHESTVARGARDLVMKLMRASIKRGTVERDGDRVRITAKGRSRVRVA